MQILGNRSSIRTIAIAIAIITTSTFWILNWTHSAKTIHREVGVVWVDADPYMWLSLSREAVKTNTMIRRYTYQDNFPEGRYVHWSSLNLAGHQLLAKMTEIKRELFENPISQKTSDLKSSAIFWNPLLLSLFLILTTTLAYRITKSATSLLLSLYLLTNVATFYIFNPLHPDQQGLLLLIGSLFIWGTAGPYLNRDTKTFIVAGLMLGVGLWASAVNIAPYFAAASLGALAVALISKDITVERKLKFREGWSQIGWLALLISILGWLLEYGLTIPRIKEVSGPLHSITILGLCQLVSLTYSPNFKKDVIKKSFFICIGIASGIFILKGFSSAFSDPAMRVLHTKIAEMSMSNLELPLFLPFLILTPILMYFWFQKRSIGSTFCLGVIEVFIIGGVLMYRLIPALLLVGIPLVFVAILTETEGNLNNKPQIQKRMKIFATLFILLWSPYQAWATILYERGELEKRISRSLSCKDTAQTILKDASKKGISNPKIFNTDPYESVILSYYLDSPSLQSVYWENTSGLKKALSIWANKDPLEAAKIIKKLGLNYIVHKYTKNPLLRSIQEGLVGNKLEEELSGEKFIEGSEYSWLVPINEKRDIYFVNQEKLSAWLQKYKESEKYQK